MKETQHKTNTGIMVGGKTFYVTPVHEVIAEGIGQARRATDETKIDIDWILVSDGHGNPITFRISAIEAYWTLDE
jgi:hypothetical protein